VRVLIVEDDASMAASLRRGLEAEGYAVSVASDGDEGLWLATEEGFDVVVLDIMLPRRNGYQVVTELRRRGRTMPVLMLTAKDGEWDQAEALDSGADDYLAKPFSYPVLLARLRALIRRSAGLADPVIAVGDLRLDPAARTVRRGDAAIELTGREFALLEYLALHAGTVVSKHDLVAHVWDTAREPDTNVVEVYVGYLRMKLGTSDSPAPIETVRSVGYRIRAPR